MLRRTAALAFAVSIPIAAHSQSAQPPLTDVTAFDVPVSESARFEEAVRQIVDAAGKAKLKAQFGWGVWHNDNTYAVVSGLQKLADMDDPMMWMRQFEQTPGQPVLMQAFQKFTGMHFREETEIMRHVPEWSYTPGAAGQPAWAEVIEYWPIAGTDQQFDAMAKEAMTILKSSAYPYMVLGYRTPLGQRRAQFVVLYDDRARHAAAQAKLEQNAQWQALGARFTPVVLDMQTSHWRFRSELSYSPTP